MWLLIRLEIRPKMKVTSYVLKPVKILKVTKCNKKIVISRLDVKFKDLVAIYVAGTIN